ncbi:MAG: preprotein translocase subunit SecY [Chloroflexi bacterium]|nr:preprotein translocase subunit SecY [Chloroflexota bacterium]
MLRAMVDAFALPDLRRKILFTLAMLVIFRFVTHIPLPGVDTGALRTLFERNQLLGLLDLFSGGAMRNLSVAAMGVYPYITSSIVMQLMVPVIPRLQALAREGEAGRNKINQITHWLTVPLAMLQGYGQLVILERATPPVISGVGLSGELLLPTVSMLLALTAGTMFLVWLGELITENGIGNGVSLIIFGGIVAGMPNYIQSSLLGTGNLGGMFVFVLLALALIVAIVIFTEAHRRIPVQYARSMFRGGRMYRQSGGTHLPLRVNMAGMIPLIFAMSIVIFPGIVASYFANAPGQPPNLANFVQNLFNANGWFYWTLYFLLALGFTFFYTIIIFQQQNLGEVLQRNGGFVPGVRPGRPTVDYLNRIVSRITWGGAVYLALVAISPYLVQKLTGVQAFQLPAIGMLIVVGVVLDTMKQLEAQLLMRHYEGFIR